MFLYLLLIIFFCFQTANGMDTDNLTFADRMALAKQGMSQQTPQGRPRINPFRMLTRSMVHAAHAQPIATQAMEEDEEPVKTESERLIDQLSAHIRAGDTTSALEVALETLESNALSNVPPLQRVKLLSALNKALVQATESGGIERVDPLARTLLCLSDSLEIKAPPSNESLLHIAARENHAELVHYFLRIAHVSEIHRACRAHLPDQTREILASEDIYNGYQAIEKSLWPHILDSPQFKKYYIKKINEYLKKKRTAETAPRAQQKIQGQIAAMGGLDIDIAWPLIKETALANGISTKKHTQSLFINFLRKPFSYAMYTSDKLELSAFMYAAKHGATQSAQALIEQVRLVGANISDWVNQQERSEGMTAYLLAAEHGHTDMMKLLREHGANASATNQWGQTAEILLKTAQANAGSTDE